jgi:hypothetical protein
MEPQVLGSWGNRDPKKVSPQWWIHFKLWSSHQACIPTQTGTQHEWRKSAEGKLEVVRIWRREDHAAHSMHKLPRSTAPRQVTWLHVTHDPCVRQTLGCRHGSDVAMWYFFCIGEKNIYKGLRSAEHAQDSENVRRCGSPESVMFLYCFFHTSWHCQLWYYCKVV